jgi:BirA family biotin operon repressor/biotin-[acetyl-CoA-carboxylase] ligase
MADHQTAGRGRGVNRWWTGSGSLACSLLFDPLNQGIERRYLTMIPLAAAAGIVEVVSQRIPQPIVGLHWPNDVFAGGRKLAGVLVEALPNGRHILGMGINVNNPMSMAPRELQTIVTSLHDLSGTSWQRTEIVADLLLRLQRNLTLLAATPLALGFRADELCLQRGLALTIEAGNRRSTGICAGIAPDGALLLDTTTGRQSHYSGVICKD